jgi:phosphoribosylformylglycinamidine synthase
MKATVLVRLKEEVLDPQGDAVRGALQRLGFEGVSRVRVGKLIEIEMDAPTTAGVGAAAGGAGAGGTPVKERLAKMADELLANPVIEDFEVRVDG